MPAHPCACRLLAAALSLACVVALAACGSPRARFRPAQLAPGEAVIYVYRPRSLLGPGPIDVYVDQLEAGKLSRNQFLAAIVTPGEHLVRVQRRSEVVRIIRIGEGESAYLEASAALLGGAVSLSSPSEDLARERIAQARAARAVSDPERPPQDAETPSP